jgi:outer membrane usher protein FimD/PapC
MMSQASYRACRRWARVQMADSGKDVGMVADDGHVWLGAVQPEQQFLVTWETRQQCRFTLPSHLKTFAAYAAMSVNHDEIHH